MVVTTTVITTAAASGIARSAVGGIAAAIVGMFLLLGAVIFFLFLRKFRAHSPSAPSQGWENGVGSDDDKTLYNRSINRPLE